MSRLESLPPDLQAVLSLLLRQRKSYAEVAGMLHIEARAVHDRAHAALALIAPREARALSAAEREQLGEYLLDQQSPGAQRETRAFLEGSPAGRAWAQTLSSELTALAAQPLADIPPAGPPAPTPSPSAGPPPSSADELPPSAHPAPPSSRTGGAIVLGVLAVAVVVAVLLIVGVGGGGSHATASSAGKGASTGASTTTTDTDGSSTTTGAGTSTGGEASTTPTTGAGTSTSGSGATHGKALALTPPDPSTSKAAGVAYVLTQNGKRAFYLFTKGLPAPSDGAFYAVWLENTPTAPAYPLGSLPAQGANGLVEGGGALPSDAGGFHHIIVTRETSKQPTHPGETVLRGAFTLAG
jgi:hypothetical protein